MRKSFLSVLFAISLFVSPGWAGVHFDNVDDFIDTNYTPSYSATDDFSWCVWAEIDNAPTGAAEEAMVGLIGPVPDSHYMVMQFEDTLCADPLMPSVYMRDDNNSGSDIVCSDTVVTAATPFHLCWTYDDSEADMFLFLNGVQVGSKTTCTQTAAKNEETPKELYAGARNNNGTADIYFDGIVYEAYFYDNVALSASEISLLYNSRMRRMPCQTQSAGLDKYLPLDDVPDGTSADGDSFRAECGSSLTAGTGNDGANNTGLTSEAEKILSYP